MDKKLIAEITEKILLLEEQRKQMELGRDNRQVADLLNYKDGQIDTLLAVRLLLQKNRVLFNCIGNV